MKLFLLESGESAYQTYEAMIVCTPDEIEARKIHPDFIAKNDWYETSSPDHKYAIDCWCSPERVKVTYLGEAAPSIKVGRILSRYNGD